MMRQFILILIVTLIACLVCLINVNSLQILYQEFMSSKSWRRVEIVDEMRTLEKLGDCSWEYADKLLFGLTTCIISLMIGWSVNSIRKRYAIFRDGDTFIECSGEHCVLNKQIKKHVEINKELEPSGLQVSKEQVSTKHLGGGEDIHPIVDFNLYKSKTTNKLCKNSSVKTSEEDYKTTGFSKVIQHSKTQQTYGEIETVTTSLMSGSTKIELDEGKIVILKDEIKTESSDKPDNKNEVFDKSWETDLRTDQNKLVNVFETVHSCVDSLMYYSENSHELSDTQCKFINKNVKSSPDSSIKETVKIDDLDFCKIKSDGYDFVVGQVQGIVKTNPIVKPRSSITNILEASADENNDLNFIKPCNFLNLSNLGEILLCEAENDLEDKTKSESVNTILKTVCDDNLEIDSNNRMNNSTKMDEELEKDKQLLSQLDLSFNSSSVFDNVGRPPVSYLSTYSRDSAFIKNSHGHKIKNKKLRKEIKTNQNTTTINKKNYENSKTTTVPYINDFLKDAPTKQKRRPQTHNRSISASGVTLQVAGGHRKEKQK